MGELVSAMVGFAVGAVLGALFRPPLRSLEMYSRRLWRRPALHVHVERDPSIIWAGDPDWVGFSLYFRAGDPLPPEVPAGRNEWLAWGRGLGGVDAGLTMLSVTLQANADVAVVVEGLRVQDEREPISEGVVVTRTVGGADLVPRHFNIQLDWSPGVVTFEGPGGKPEAAPKIKMAPGEIERFHIWAYASSELHRWSVDLVLLVDGRREIVTIDDDGAPFLTAGTSGLPQRMNQAGTTELVDWPDDTEQLESDN